MEGARMPKLHYYRIVLLFFGLSFAQRPVPQSEGGVLVFYDQLSTALTDQQCQFVATHACGTQKVPLSFIDRIRAYNPDFLLLHYELSFGAGDLFNLEGEDWVSDWDSINPYENWFLHDGAGHRCHQTDWDWDFMDPSGAIEGAVPGWKEYWVRRAKRRMRLNDCDGIFSDSHGMPWNMDYYPEGYVPPDDGGLGDNFTIFDQYVMAQLHNDSTDFLFIPNLAQMITGWDATDYTNCDGAMIELFSTYDCYDHFEPEDWELEADRVLELANLNKILIFQHDVDYWSPECRMWLIANYFMMKNSRSFVNLLFPDWCEDGMYPNWLAEYEINLGNFDGPIPTSAADMYNAPWDAYVRYYQRGMVIVNNSWSATAVSFPDTYYVVSDTGGGCVNDTLPDWQSAIFFTPTTGFTMPAMTAAIVTYTNDPMTIVGEHEKTRRIDSHGLSVSLANRTLLVCAGDAPYTGSLRIRDIAGRTVFSAKCHDGRIALPHVAAGAYFAIAPGMRAGRFVVVE